MNEQLDTQAVNDILAWLLGTAKSTEAFVLDQAPDLAQEIITYGYVSNGLAVLVALCLLVVSPIIFYRVSQDFDTEGWGIILMVLSGVTAWIAVMVLVFNVPILIKVIVAPKLYLLDYIRGML